MVCGVHTSFITEIEDHLASRGLEYLTIGPNMELVHTFGSSPSCRVLVVDMTREDWVRALFLLKEHFPFGVHIFICE